MQDNNTVEAELMKLIETHQRLDDEADALNARQYLTPLEQTKLKNIKIARLMARQAVDTYRRENDLLAGEGTR